MMFYIFSRTVRKAFIMQNCTGHCISDCIDCTFLNAVELDTQVECHGYIVYFCSGAVCSNQREVLIQQQ